MSSRDRRRLKMSQNNEETSNVEEEEEQLVLARIPFFRSIAMPSNAVIFAEDDEDEDPLLSPSSSSPLRQSLPSSPYRPLRPPIRPPLPSSPLRPLRPPIRPPLPSSPLRPPIRPPFRPLLTSSPIRPSLPSSPQRAGPSGVQLRPQRARPARPATPSSDSESGVDMPSTAASIRPMTRLITPALYAHQRRPVLLPVPMSRLTPSLILEAIEAALVTVCARGSSAPRVAPAPASVDRPVEQSGANGGDLQAALRTILEAVEPIPRLVQPPPEDYASFDSGVDGVEGDRRARSSAVRSEIMRMIDLDRPSQRQQRRRRREEQPAGGSRDRSHDPPVVGVDVPATRRRSVSSSPSTTSQSSNTIRTRSRGARTDRSRDNSPPLRRSGRVRRRARHSPESLAILPPDYVDPRREFERQRRPGLCQNPLCVAHRRRTESLKSRGLPTGCGRPPKCVCGGNKAPRVGPTRPMGPPPRPLDSANEHEGDDETEIEEAESTVAAVPAAVDRATPQSPRSPPHGPEATDTDSSATPTEAVSTALRRCRLQLRRSPTSVETFPLGTVVCERASDVASPTQSSSTDFDSYAHVLGLTRAVIQPSETTPTTTPSPAVDSSEEEGGALVIDEDAARSDETDDSDEGTDDDGSVICFETSEWECGESTSANTSSGCNSNNTSRRSSAA